MSLIIMTAAINNMNRHRSGGSLPPNDEDPFSKWLLAIFGGIAGTGVLAYVIYFLSR